MHRRIALLAVLGGLMVMLAGCATVGNLIRPELVYGSGIVTEKSFDADDFTKVYIASGFSGAVTYGETFSVVVQADDNIVDSARITVDDGTLLVLMQRKNYQNVARQHVTITMPVLEEIALHGISRAEIDGFPRTDSLVVRVEGTSQLSGELNANRVDIAIAGMSKATLAGEAETLSLNVSAASVAYLAELSIDDAEVTLAGSSRADVTVAQTIALKAEDSSTLTYGGGAALTHSELTGGSTAIER